MEVVERMACEVDVQMKKRESSHGRKKSVQYNKSFIIPYTLKALGQETDSCLALQISLKEIQSHKKERQCCFQFKISGMF